ncbi:proton-conducting transporter membrane subunit [Salinisphaera sp.]|uniref:NADH-quinone oxidoreductase subunit 5 family protein n=1 Tax=Salinisphaera sp. TaxID=1914330 RepID=UPI000C55B46F|nr:proton-conducting transporter membrane subunit [Salinisphaera sp.]MBS63144.1 proton-conducting membrane transporter [Salinisphaera sp.]
MLWLVALFPLLAAVIVHASPMRNRATLGASGCGVLLVTLVLTVFAGLEGWVGRIAWSIPLQFEVALTTSSVVMALLVSVIALPVLAYAAVHERRRDLNRLVSLLLLFVGAMLLLVIAADLITLLIGWELVGACSWALIGHERQHASRAASARYAFVMTRLGDLGLFVAAMVAFSDRGTFAFAAIETLGAPQKTILVAGLLLSAASKSGQIPFAPWLFRAMDGPTSVSALLHSATMVAAGAYLLIRLEPTLAQVPWFGPAAICIGLGTALAGGLTAMLQPHAKKLLAASTSAHYGLMFVAVGAGYPAVALTHLVAHAFFKALLFLSAGVAGREADSFYLTKMGFGRVLPITASATAVGGFALAGIPPLGAAWTKEMVVTAAGHFSPWLAFVVMLAGALSAAYAMRFVYSAYGVAVNDTSATTRTTETIAISSLAAACLALSLYWLPGIQQTLGAWLATSFPTPPPWETIGSLLTVGFGLYTGLLIARKHPALGEDGPVSAYADWLGLPFAINRVVERPFSALTQHCATFDDAVIDGTVRRAGASGLFAARVAYRGLDRLADGLPEGVTRWLALSGEDSRRFQTGLSHHYLAFMAAGAVVLAIILFAGR